MKIVRILEVFHALNELNKLSLPAKPKYSIGKAIRKLTPHVKYFDEENKIALTTFAVKRADILQEQIDALDTTVEGYADQLNSLKVSLNASNGLYDFATPENAKDYNEKILFLQNEDLDVDLSKVSISEFNNISIENARMPNGTMYSPVEVLIDDFIVD